MSNEESSDPGLSEVSGHSGKAASRPEPGLYLVATPIGNLRDITLRALDVLGAVDAVACEDTRRTGRLLSAFGLSARLVRYDEHAAARARPKLLATLAGGGTVALVSDAGTPLISDPGYRLVEEAVAAGIPVRAVPGASSVLAGLTVSALPTDRFLYAGFLPSRGAARRRAVAALAAIDATLVLLESPKRVAATLKDLAAALGPRPAALARELTKRFEEVLRDDLAALAARVAETPPRGECVIVIGPPSEAGGRRPLDDSDIDAMLVAALAAAPPAAAAHSVAAATGRPRRELYARAVMLKRAGDDAP